MSRIALLKVERLGGVLSPASYDTQVMIKRRATGHAAALRVNLINSSENATITSSNFSNTNCIR